MFVWTVMYGVGCGWQVKTAGVGDILFSGLTAFFDFHNESTRGWPLLFS